jgi:hypothetical protein
MLGGTLERLGERGFELVARVRLSGRTAYVCRVDPFAFVLDGQRKDDGAAGDIVAGIRRSGGDGPRIGANGVCQRMPTWKLAESPAFAGLLKPSLWES